MRFLFEPRPAFAQNPDSRIALRVIVYDGNVAAIREIALRPDRSQSMQALDANGTLSAELTLDGRTIGFFVEGLTEEAIATCRWDSSTQLSVQIRHAQLGGCRVRCYDGKTGHPCVECTRGGRTIRVCC